MKTADISEVQRSIMADADMIACAVVKMLTPAKDLVSKRALYKEFGQAWVDSHIWPKGNIEGKRSGPHKNSAIKFSRAECMALLKAEQICRADVNWKNTKYE